MATRFANSIYIHLILTGGRFVAEVLSQMKTYKETIGR